LFAFKRIGKFAVQPTIPLRISFVWVIKQLNTIYFIGTTMKRLTALTCGTITVLALLLFLNSGSTSVEAQQKVGKDIAASECTISMKQVAILASERVGVLKTVKRASASQDLDLGHQVFKGEVVASLNDDIPVAALKTAKKKAKNDVQIRYADKAAQVAEQELEINKVANAKLEGTVPAVEIKKLELAAERGTLQIEQAQFEFDVAKLTVEEAEAQVDSFLVKAPFDGFVRKIHRHPGESVRQGDPIMEVFSEATMQITGYISIAQSYKVSSGDLVKVQLVLKEADLEIERIWLDGTVALVDPEGAPLLNRVKVVAEVANKKVANKYILKAGLDANMWIKPGSHAAIQAAAKR
jgi:biotin carboxyl carrier protein